MNWIFQKFRGKVTTPGSLNTSKSAPGRPPRTLFLGVQPSCQQCLNGLECEAHDRLPQNLTFHGAMRSKSPLSVAWLLLPDLEAPKTSLSTTSDSMRVHPIQAFFFSVVIFVIVYALLSLVSTGLSAIVSLLSI